MVYASDYSNEIDNAIKANLINIEDIYDFRETPLEDILSSYYIFCRENLNLHSTNEKITPNIFLFTNWNEINARATVTSNKQFIITLNLGLLKYCFSNYFQNAEFHTYFKKIHPETVEKFDNPSNVLAFQVCIQFTYYHELAHLFQLSTKQTETQVQERNNTGATIKFNRLNHLLEINADIYASISVATHIEQYIKNIFDKDISYNNIFNALQMFCCCLLNYSISLTEKPEEIYFEAHTHPHCFIRLLNIILNLTNHIEQSTYFRDNKIKINSNNLFVSVIKTYKDIESQKIFKTNFSEVINKNIDSMDQITEYLYSLNQFDSKEYANAMDFWNKQVL